MSSWTEQEQANVATMRGFLEEVLNGGNVEKAGDYLSDEMVDHSLPPGVPGSIEGFREWFAEFTSTFPDAVWTMEAITADGDRIARHQSFTATHAPTGKKVSAGETGIARLEGGRVVEYWGVMDEKALDRQLAEPQTATG
jgi:predicted ester cyclase